MPGLGISLAIAHQRGRLSSLQSTLEAYIASQLPNIPSARRGAIASAMIASVSGQSYFATDIVDSLAASSTLHWTSADAAKCYTLSTDSTPNVSLTGVVGKIDPYKGTLPFTQATTGARPTIQSGGLRFDGVDDYLTAGYAFSNPVGTYLVVRRIGAANQFADIIGGSGDRNFGLITDASNTLIYATVLAEGTNSGFTSTVTNISNPSLLGFVVNGASSAFYDGLTATSSGTLASASTTSQIIGARATLAASTFSNIELQDLIVNTDTTKALQILRFLKAYRGL